MSIADCKTTDTIPRASIAQILGTIGHLTSVEKSDFDAVRRFLYSLSGRRTPASQTALWTVARDVLTELQRLGLATVGTLPRRRPDIDRFRESPCEITPVGADLAHVHTAKSGQAYDTLLLAWLNSHPYFRELISHILASRLYVPDVTSAVQVGGRGGKSDPRRRGGRNCRSDPRAISSACGFHRHSKSP